MKNAVKKKRNTGLSSSVIIVKGIRIAKEIISKKFSQCDLHACKHACCHQGALVGTKRIKEIKKHLPKLFPMMRQEAVALVKRKGFHLDSIYSRFDLNQGHVHHYIRVCKNRCVFLAYDDSGGCVLQKYAAKHNVKYVLKPDGCWSFPIDLIGNRLVVYKWDKLPCLNDAKNKNSPPIYKTCKNEIIDFLGKDGYAQLLDKVKKQLSSAKE
ncbi:MAG: hypothetical protein A2252_02890 [Elusimicrobia bacterium RIFOXYA2_FULL_39_19]|nr:MAG: hypothetical protein A2252_02890 [Elusimicrobia bacterium RIFOXYA2_FULL_39_19]